MSTPSVSIVIPIHNTERWLATCVDSVLSQSWRDLEVICVDDGSTDRSAEIVGDYLSRDSRVSLIRQDNEGAGPARNRGLSAARGEWVYFLDSDDWIEPHAIESLVELGRRLDCEVVYCNMASNSYWPAGPIARMRRTQLTNRRWRGSEYLGPAIRARAFRYSPCTQILRRDFLLRHSISFPPQRIGEDVAFSVEVVLRAAAVAYHPEALFYRNLRPGSLTTGSSTVDTIRDALMSHQALREIPSRVPLDPAALASLGILTRRLWRHALHQFDQFPKPLRDVLRGEHLAPDNPDLGRELIEQTARGRFERAISRLRNRKPLLVASQ